MIMFPKSCEVARILPVLYSFWILLHLEKFEEVKTLFLELMEVFD